MQITGLIREVLKITYALNYQQLHCSQIIIFVCSYFRELRSKIPNLILLNFCTALSLLLITFLVPLVNESSKFSSLLWCRVSAVALHYFLLVAFMWMAVEAFNMYRSFVQVFTAVASPSSYVAKCCLFAWGKTQIFHCSVRKDQRTQAAERQGECGGQKQKRR